MVKTFITGTVLGIAAMVALLYAVPAVDQHREASIISVTPNGGNAESFHINVPMDRIMIGAGNVDDPLPPGLEWPAAPVFAGTRTEIFKLRNSRNAVVGVASRLAASDPQLGNVIEWVLHLPARGSMYVSLDSAAGSGGRNGRISAGTREFESLVGQVSERWVADRAADEGAAGRIELNAVFLASAPPDDEDADVEDRQ